MKSRRLAAFIVIYLCVFSGTFSVFGKQTSASAERPISILLVDIDGLLHQWALVKIDRIDAVAQKHLAAYAKWYGLWEKESDLKEKQKYDTLRQAEFDSINGLKAELQSTFRRVRPPCSEDAPEYHEIMNAIEEYRVAHGYSSVYALKNKAHLRVPKAPKSISGDDGTKDILALLKEQKPSIPPASAGAASSDATQR